MLRVYPSSTLQHLSPVSISLRKCAFRVQECTSRLAGSCFAPEHSSPRQDVNVSSPISITYRVSSPSVGFRDRGREATILAGARAAAAAAVVVLGGWKEAVIWWIPQRDSFHLLHFALSPILPLWCPILIFLSFSLVGFLSLMAATPHNFNTQLD